MFQRDTLNSELSGSMVKGVKYSILYLKAVKALQELGLHRKVQLVISSSLIRSKARSAT